MPAQARVHKETSRRGEMDELADEDVKATSQTDGERVTVEDVDALLDEIDGILEQNDAAEFMRGWIQKGGE